MRYRLDYLLLVTFLFSASTLAADSLVRVACDDEAAGAEVNLDGKFKGECTLDFPVTEGSHKLSVIKKLDQERFRVFELQFRIGEGVVKRIDVTLGQIQLSEEGRRQQAQREREEAERLQVEKRLEAERLAEQQRIERQRQQEAMEAAKLAEAQAQVRKVAERKRLERQPGYTFKDCDTCPEMVVVPGGSFSMGSTDGGDEGPVHTVQLPTFAIAKTEITQDQWLSLVGANPSHFPECGRNCPVERVSWNNAKAFVAKLSEKTGKTYRLPTEAEWEYACRAGGDKKYCGSDDIDDVGWLGGFFSMVSQPHPVGTKSANGWGLYDMSGNVAEWVEDCWHDSYEGAPSDGSAWTSGNCEKRVVRGGCATLVRKFSRATYRSSYPPHLGYFCNGFRPVRVLTP